MYFSRNSRYVLQKAHILSPKFFNAAEKSLSFKTPKDDPSKPPLRLNIPDEPHSKEEQTRPEVTEAKSGCFASKPETPIPTVLENDFWPGTESELPFSNFASSEALTSDTARKYDTSAAPSKETIERIPLVEGSTKDGLKDTDDIDSKSLYIIVDVPDKSEGRSTEGSKHPNRLPTIDPGDYEEAFASESDLYKRQKSVNAAVGNNKSLPRFPFLKGKPKHTKRFEIAEIEDTAMYVFHLKLNKNKKTRPTRMNWVPEKEITTRYESLDAKDAPIKVADAVLKPRSGSSGKPIASNEEVSELPTSDTSRAKVPRSGKITQVAVSEPETAQKYKRKVIDTFFRKDRSPPKFEGDDYGAVKAAAKNYPFKLPSKKSPPKEEVRCLEGAGETEPQYQSAKMVEANEDYLTVHANNTPAEQQQRQEQLQQQLQQRQEQLQQQQLQQRQEQLQQQQLQLQRRQLQLQQRQEQLQHRQLQQRHEQQQQQQQEEVVEAHEDPYPYYSIHELKANNAGEKSTETGRKSQKPKKKLSSNGSERMDAETLNFQTVGNYVSIDCEKVSNTMKFGAAFPPLLNEALKTRLKFKKNFFFTDKQGGALNKKRGFENLQTPGFDNDLSENSILFPKKDKFDCEALFTTNEEIIVNLINNFEEKKTSTVNETLYSDNMTEHTNPAPMDSLTVMKKVKEIVQFDLDNVIKIFDGPKPSQELSSVVVLKGDTWEVDTEELLKQTQIRANTPTEIDFQNIIMRDFIGDASKYLPPKEETEMKLSKDIPKSVISFNGSTNEFFINKEALGEVIARKANEPHAEVVHTLNLLAEDGKRAMETKTGDSILVFDDETQSWKVDFSILEKREEQLRLERELTKTSEMILETFEKLEKGQMPAVPMPETRDKQTFDYKNEQWNAYTEKHSKNSAKPKSPFKEPDAEEIRRKNSDMYENLFIANKKDSTMEKVMKKSPSWNQSNPAKKSKECVLAQNKESSGSTQQPPGSTPVVPPQAPPKDVPPAQHDKKIPPQKEEGNFWETFLNMGILPRNIEEIPKTPTAPPPASKIPSEPVTPPKIEKPAEETKKIEEPLFRLRIPFIKERRDEKSTDNPPKGETKTEKGEKSPPTSGQKKPDVKAPPPTTPTPKDDPKTLKSPPTIGSGKTPPNVKTPSVQGDPKSGKNNKVASAPDHYVSDKIIEISRSKSSKNGQPKVKTNKVETVKLNISSDKRVPSKVTEINLNKKFEERMKEPTTQSAVGAKKPSNNPSKTNEGDENKFYKNFDKYKTPFSEPDFEEKSVNIKSDIESNPNLKKLDNWNKTLVLHDIMKPPENIESWLKDETDKMATLLLKVLQEAAEGKPKKKQLPVKAKTDKNLGKANPYDNIRKKQENTPENFLFRVRAMNLTLDNEKKLKQGENAKLRPEGLKDIPVQSERTVKSAKVVDAKVPEKAVSSAAKGAYIPVTLEDGKFKAAQAALETSGDFSLISKDLANATKLSTDITEEIPGPEILKKISNTWKMFPVLGSQMTIFTLLRVYQLVNMGRSILNPQSSNLNKKRAFTKLFTKYGPIVNVQGPLSGNVILIHSPEHLTAVFEQDITVSVRSVFDSLEQVRRESEDTTLAVGISTDWTKPEWKELKRVLVDPLITGSGKYFGSVSVAADSLISNIRRNRNAQNCVSDDFMENIRRWSLEGLCNVLFEKSFGFLEGRSSSLSWIMEPEKLYMALEEATHCLNKCERGFQLWRLMTTPSAMGLSRANRSLTSILSKQLYQSEMNLKGKNEEIKAGNSLPIKDLTFIESMMLNDGMTTEELMCNLVDIILIGTNTMSSAMGFLLYDLAQNVKSQMKLMNELKEVLPSKGTPLNYHKLISLKYLQACLKESLRLHFPVPVFYRLLQSDILLANYIIPKGTYVVMDYTVSSMKEQIFDDPDKFVPERWLKEERWMQGIHPFSTFPLCLGPRSELAKRVVEMQLLACVAKIIRNFQVEYQYGEIQGTDCIISSPNKPLKINFAEREQ